MRSIETRAVRQLQKSLGDLGTTQGVITDKSRSKSRISAQCSHQKYIFEAAPSECAGVLRHSSLGQQQGTLKTRQACVYRKPRPFDLMTESLNVGQDGRADIPPVEPGCFALQTQEPA